MRYPENIAAQDAGDDVGEVVETSTAVFVAQCIDPRGGEALRLFDPPPFGALVKIGGDAPGGGAPLLPPSVEPTEEPDPFDAPHSRAATGEASRFAPGLTLAIVSGARTASLDAGRRPMALGYATVEELRNSQPQVFELLTTEFSGLLVGHTDGDGILRRHLPPRPPRVHARVSLCTERETLAATADASVLERVLDGSAGAGVPADELASAVLRHGWQARGQDQAYLVDVGAQLASLLRGDYDRLQRIVRRVLSA